MSVTDVVNGRTVVINSEITDAEETERRTGSKTLKQRSLCDRRSVAFAASPSACDFNCGTFYVTFHV